ncbi:hypothetical protein, partial [Enterobacter hormaechei]|uniref:hypothetical protein n=1 Tax=Enterobacter hormaechei TaxID=158836 RepID=UPI0020417BE4
INDAGYVGVIVTLIRPGQTIASTFKRGVVIIHINKRCRPGYIVRNGKLLCKIEVVMIFAIVWHTITGWGRMRIKDAGQ